jgi:hypothetical protein
MNAVIVQKILNRMQSCIEQCGLKLMQHYPDDLLVHDKAMLSTVAVPGAKIAWVVGHMHTHIVPLGFNSGENKNVVGMINLSKEDRFFIIAVSHGEKFTMTEVPRAEFAALSKTPVAYTRAGEVNNFWLMRNKQKIGHIVIRIDGNANDQKATATITPVVGVDDHGIAALHIWASTSIVEYAHTLFIRSEAIWNPPYQGLLAA